MIVIPDFTDPADDPSSPDYRLTAEHYPRYLLNTKQPIVPSKEDDAAPIERLPNPESLQHGKEEVIIRSDDFADFKFIRELSNICVASVRLADSTGI